MHSPVTVCRATAEEIGSVEVHLARVDPFKRDRSQYYGPFSGMLEIDRRTALDNRLYLAEAPVQFAGMPNEVSGNEILGHDK